MVVESAALSGHRGQQPHLVAGSGAQPVVPAGGRVVLDEVLPPGAVGGDGAGQAEPRTRTRWRGARAAAGAGAVLRGCRRRSGGRCRCSWVRWFLGGELGCRGAVSVRVTDGEGALVRASAPEAGRGFASVAARQPERGTAQQLGQQQQLQRARAAPWDPAVRVEVSAKFASMPISTSVHTSTVNFVSAIWECFTSSGPSV